MQAACCMSHLSRHLPPPLHIPPTHPPTPTNQSTAPHPPTHPPCPQVRASFQQALELVAKEAAGEAGKLPEAGAAAEAVEAALYTLFGESLFCCHCFVSTTCLQHACAGGGPSFRCETAAVYMGPASTCAAADCKAVQLSALADGALNTHISVHSCTDRTCVALHSCPQAALPRTISRSSAHCTST